MNEEKERKERREKKEKREEEEKEKVEGKGEDRKLEISVPVNCRL